MRWLYDTDNRLLRTPKKEIELTKLEARLLDVLCNNAENTWSDITEYVYGYYDEHALASLRHVVSKFEKKTNMMIINIRGVRSWIER